MGVISAILYYLVIIPVSLLPFRLLYGLSDLTCWFLQSVIGYRKQVVRNNLQNAFPNKTQQELKRIQNLFYQQFCDNLLESIKGLTLSKQSVQKRMVCENPELLDAYFEQGRSVIITTGHFYSWELWFLAIDQPLKHKVVLLYKKLSNRYFENKLKAIRSGFGLIPVDFKETKAYMQSEEDGQKAYIFGSDQSPREAHKAYWVKFLNQDTAFTFGAEKLAKQYNMGIVFSRISKTKRGFYTFRYTDLNLDPNQAQYGDATKAFCKILENTIHSEPQGWLWSHKRWKREKPEGVEVHPL